MMWEANSVGGLNNLSNKGLLKGHWMSKKCLKVTLSAFLIINRQFLDSS